MSETPVPAIGMSVAVDCMDGRGLTIQTHVPQDMPLEQQHAMADRLFAIADRKRAQYELPMFEAKLLELETAKTAYETTAKNLDKDFAEQVEKMEAQKADIIKARDAVAQDGYNQHVARGKQGKFELKGAAESRYNALDAQVQKIDADIVSRQNQHANDVAQFRINKQKWDHEHEVAKANVAAARKLLEG